MLKMRRSTALWLILGVAACLPGAAARAQEAADDAAALAVVVHKSNQKDQITVTELRKIFTLEKLTWSDGDKIRVYVQEPGGFEHDIMLSEVYRMTEAQLAGLWVEKLADNVAGGGPKATSNRNIIRSVARDTQAIGLIDAAASDGTVKVLRVNGLPPDSPNYPLKEESP